MPIYEYRCPKCGVFELEQRITAAPLKECPTCGESVYRIIGRNIGIVYNASGFYITDNRKENRKAKNEGKAEETKKPESKAS